MKTPAPCPCALEKATNRKQNYFHGFLNFRSQRSFATVLVSVACLFLASANAQTTPPNFADYSAKFLCGTQPTTQGATAPGTYFTSINIHNPQETLFSNMPPVRFLKKAVLSLEEGITPQPPSPFVTDVLPSDFAEQVDCLVIRRLLGPIAPPAPAFIEGYVVIVVPPTNITNVLDVVGVYTNSAGALEVKPANEHFFAPGGIPVITKAEPVVPGAINRPAAAIAGQ
jgi:hypothetical protein